MKGIDRIRIPKLSKNNPEKCNKIKQLFDITEDKTQEQKKLLINYNEKIFFKPKITDEKNKDESEQIKLKKIINDVINSNLSGNLDSIKLNLNINNNYYNSNYNCVMSNPNDFDTIKNDKFSTEKIKQGSNYDDSDFKINDESLPIQIENKNTKNILIDSISYQNKKSHQKDTNLIIIPCINCNNLISLEEVDIHSNHCLIIKEEVIQADKSGFTFQMVDFKLKKLHEHINTLKLSENHGLNNDLQKQAHLISLLIKYIEDAINASKIEHKTVTELKKILVNIDTLTMTHKGKMSTLVIIERTRLLVYQKMSILKEDLKKLMITKKLDEKKSGKINSLKVINLEKEKEEKQKLAEKLINEREMILRKVNSLKRFTPPDISVDVGLSTLNLAKNESLVESEINDGNNIDSNKILSPRIVLTDIDSNFEKSGLMSPTYSDYTSMSSSASLSDVEGRSSFNLEKDTKNVINLNDQSNSDLKKLYQEFVKVVLKIKFEKFNNSHSGQKIPEKILFKECRNLNLPKSKWSDFIIGELHQIEKYSQFLKKEKNKGKNFKQYYSAHMDTIVEDD